MRPCCRPNAPASMLRFNPVPSPLSPMPRPPHQPPVRVPAPPQRLLFFPPPVQPRQPVQTRQIDRMTAHASEGIDSSLCARLDRVSKLFGSFAALRQLSVDLEPGRCYVLLGENGAGKSTLLRILAGLLRPSFGSVKVFGGLDPHAARERIGYMSHAPLLYAR